MCPFSCQSLAPTLALYVCMRVNGCMTPLMRPNFHVEIVTPKKVLLQGLWFGPEKASRVIVWVHGLGGSAFSMARVIDAIVDPETAILAFNNRGHDVVSSLKRVALKTAKKSKRVLSGAAHERFVDCIDDIEGALQCAKRIGAKDIFLAGHSTGCQKSIYWASKSAGRGVRGIILLAPVNDYAGALAWHGKKKVLRATQFAQKMVTRGKALELLPSHIWSEEPDDAERFLSLYTPESVENIFPYNESRAPKTLRKVRKPVIVLWAEKDEYADRPAAQVTAWFARHVRNWRDITVVKDVKHSFKGGEDVVARHVRSFMNEVGMKRQ